MSRAISEGAGERYGVKRVCAAWELPRSSVYARRAARLRVVFPAKRGPKTRFSDAELVEKIREVLAASPFLGEGYRKVWAKLRFAGIRTGKARVRRLMRKNGLLAPHRIGPARGPRAHDGTIIPAAPDLMWGTDFTSTFTVREGPACVFVCVDHCTAELLGVHAAKSATRWEALEPVKQAVRETYGAIRKDVAAGLSLRHDHGTQYCADDFQREIAFLGIESSPSFVRAPEGNGCAERIIRTLKEQLLWVRNFDTVEELRVALLAWQKLYNEQWMIERHGHRSPAQRRRDHYATVQAAMQKKAA
jgi:transposase InsO family protein